MNPDLIILPAVALLSAGVGAAVMWWLAQEQTDYLRLAIDVYQSKARKAEARITAALSHIPPYSRGCNGALQKVGKILRGE